MDNSNQPVEDNSQEQAKSFPWILIVIIILLLIAIGFAWQYTGAKPDPVIVDKPLPELIEPEPIVEETHREPELPLPEVKVIEEDITPKQPPLPPLNESDSWLKLKLPEITWRKELLLLIVDEDIIRRFVVFTDNFAQGMIAYDHSPFVLPKTKFTPDLDSGVLQEVIQAKTKGKQNVWQWSDSESNRFNTYVELLRNIDSDTLVQWYMDAKPLIDEAYGELGYEDNFTQTLQDAITRVLDMELPKTSMAIIQPGVMYKFANPELEALPASDKLLLRLGKDNLLVVKSVLLEIHEKLAQQYNGVN